MSPLRKMMSTEKQQAVVYRAKATHKVRKSTRRALLPIAFSQPPSLSKKSRALPPTRAASLSDESRELPL